MRECLRMCVLVCVLEREKESVLASVGDWECVCVCLWVKRVCVCVFVSCDYVYMRVRLSAYCKSVRRY